MQQEAQASTSVHCKVLPFGSTSEVSGLFAPSSPEELLRSPYKGEAISIPSSVSQKHQMALCGNDTWAQYF